MALMTLPDGVKHQRLCWGDMYVGTIDALVAAGLAKREHFPGMPGMRKHSVVVTAEGKVHAGILSDDLKVEGTRNIARRGSKRFVISIYASTKEVERRERQERETRELEQAQSVATVLLAGVGFRITPSEVDINRAAWAGYRGVR